MNKTTKVLLVLAIVSFIVGFAFNSGLVNAGENDALYAVFPMGAVFAGLFLLSKMLEKETARYDEEHHGEEGSPGSKENPGAH